MNRLGVIATVVCSIVVTALAAWKQWPRMPLFHTAHAAAQFNSNYDFKADARWTAPIGIPEPEFGVLESAPPVPDPWNKPVEGFYYVAADVPGATDEANDFGHPARPRLTIPLDLPPGAVVEVHGEYIRDHDSPHYIRASGTRTAPVWIRGKDAHKARPTFTRSLVVYGSYAVVENILFDHSAVTAQGGQVGVGLPNSDRDVKADCATQKRPACSDHIVFRHNELRGSTGRGAFRACGGLSVGGWTENLPTGSNHTHVVFWDNYIHDEGQMDPLTDEDQACSVIGVGRYSNRVWVVDNVCENVAQSCVQINGFPNGSDYADINFVYVGRNRSNRASKNAFWVKGASDVIFSQNIAHDTIEKSYNPSTAFGLQYGPQRVWFLYNEAYNVTGGIWMASDSDGGPDKRYFLIGNVIHHITRGPEAFRKWDADQHWSPAAIFDATGGTVHIVDNVIWNINEANGINKPVTGGAHHIFGNIIGGFSQKSSWPVLFEDSAEFARSAMDYNLIWPFRVKVDDEVFTSPRDLSGYHKCAHCIARPPTFRNLEANDFAPMPDSPVLRNGTVAPAYGIFQQMYGIDIRKDPAGRPRSAAEPPDIGPYSLSE